MKNILKISAAAFSILLGSCIKDVTPPHGDRHRGPGNPRNAGRRYPGGARKARVDRLQPGLGFRASGHPPRYGVHDGRHRHYGQYRLRLVSAVGNQRCARIGICRRCASLEQLLHLDYDGEQRHQPDRRNGHRHAGRQGAFLPGFRLCLSGHVLSRPGASLRVQGEHGHPGRRPAGAGRSHRAARDHGGPGQEQPPCNGRRDLRFGDFPRSGEGREAA